MTVEWAESAALKGLQGPASPTQVSAVMEARQLIVWGVAVACLSLSDARVLNVVVPTFWDGDVKKPALMADVAMGAASPERDHSRQPARNTGNPQGNRIRPAARKLPEGPVDLLDKVPHLVHRQSVKTDRLAVRCGESKVQVEVKQDLMGTGKLVKPGELTLGGCSPTEVDNWAHVLAFESELQGCGSTLEVRTFPTSCLLVPPGANLLSLSSLDEGEHLRLRLQAHLQSQEDRQNANYPEPERHHRCGVPLPEVTPPLDPQLL